MTEASQSITRLLALIAFTALFASLWSNDQPTRALALKTTPISQGIVQTEPEWVLVDEIALENSHEPVNAQAEMQIALGGRSKSISVESTDLLIADEVLQAHLDQLPIGLPAGDYRIVDSLGGVGWLRVRTDGDVGISNPQGRMLSTTVGEESVRFIRVSETAIGSKPAQTVQ